MNKNIKRIILSLLALVAAGIGPNLFVISQAGYANLSDLAVSFLIPSIIFIFILIGAGIVIDEKDTSKQILTGIVAGLIGTIGLEIVREIGFHLGGMPGDLPKLMGVLLLDRFALGPDTWSNIAGWSYHFWNGASFGIIYIILIGKGKVWYGLIYGVLLGVVFMVSPVVVALGVGKFGVDFGIGFPITVTLAHITFGLLLGWYIQKKVILIYGILDSIKNIFSSNKK